MVDCSVCGLKLGIGTGKMFVRGDGKIFYFCGSKCEKSFNLGRDPIRLRWVKQRKPSKKA